MNFLSLLDELVKLGAVSDAEAQKSIDRLDVLEKERPTLGQVGRYGVLGAGAGALGKVVGQGIEHGRLPTSRGALGAAAVGAIGMGAVPLARRVLDRRAEIGTLKKYMSQEHLGQYAENPSVATHAPPFESGGKVAAFMRLLKVAAMGTLAMPPTKGLAGALKGMPHIPKPGRLPVIGSGDFGATKFISPGATAVTQTAATLAPRALKTAATRAVKEWRAATAAGQQGTAGQIAQASGQLGLKPRYLKDISSGGAEAGVDLMMGHTGGAETPASGLIARKLYKPESVMSRGEDTTELLKQKQEMTDTARGLGPEAKAMVPAMYGHQVHQAPGVAPRHTSMHEFVPGAQEISGRMGANPAVGAAEQHVIKPLAQRGLEMGDVVANKGNLVQSPQGPKILDFMPRGGGGRPDVPRKSILGLARTMTPAQTASSDALVQHSTPGVLRQRIFNPGYMPKKLEVHADPFGPNAGRLVGAVEQKAVSGVRQIAKPMGQLLRRVA